ncbi:helix-turn-helix domain-containing protein [Apilactobacillus timberlakei]|uniref:XRE family transcriptional regulator n=1 Tax=Apilactobacillus timberlakei TaxID=2008380 RepID=A0ABY2Z058_9LACO|nr:helix-turn-helix transcriptional regulator [Apilactobacillus timberlakei]TPR14888.1 XRE family transcriptional regulator [Apilactobacillus timberlakei]TPR15858.1 XRE family transcriptional regulator [Apilactobacillus timberlakei]TPR16219.1 XRE family transcriptional regulator [Apilactobacillus timberlakei]
MRLIGQRLRIIRYSKDLSVSEVAIQTSINAKAIKQIESGYILPEFFTMTKFSQCYKTPLKELIPEQKIHSKIIWHNIGTILFSLLTLITITFSSFDISTILFPLLTFELIYNNYKIHKVLNSMKIVDPNINFLEKWMPTRLMKVLAYIFIISYVVLVIFNIIKYFMQFPILTSICLISYTILIYIFIKNKNQRYGINP